MENREEIVTQLATLAMEAQLAYPIDWAAMGVNKAEAFKMMAGNVVDQFDGIAEANFAAVAMATITKLLVENYILNLLVTAQKND